MNVRRGFFRLWIAASVLWIAVVAFVARYEPREIVTRFQGPGRTYEMKVPQGTTRSELRDGIAKYLKDKGTLDNDATRWAEEAAGKAGPVPFWATYSDYILAGIIAPAGTLILGFILAWIFTGFSSKQSRPTL